MIDNTNNVFLIYAVAWPTLGKLLIPWCLTVTPLCNIGNKTSMYVHKHAHMLCFWGGGGKSATEWKWKIDLNFARYVVILRFTPRVPGLSQQMSPSAEPSQQPNAPHFSEVSFPSHQMCWMRYGAWQCAMPWPLRFHRKLRDLSTRNIPSTESQPSLKWQWHQPLKTDAYNPNSRKYEFW